MDPVIAQMLASAGVAGAVLAWFMTRTEKRLDRLEQALDRLARAQMLTLLARPDVEDAIKSQVRTILAEMNVGQPADLASMLSAQRPSGQ
jgi:uncharacterized membrane-anchored protein YjiN (DUF445 family)